MKNIGSYDAGVRFIGGCVILFIGSHTESAWGWWGLVPLATALAEFCPLYWVFRIDTTSSDRPTGPDQGC